MTRFEKGENKATEEMTIKKYYEEIIELSAEFIEKHNYKRSGKSGIFYKYNSDKSKGWIIGFRKSRDNSSEYCKFWIKFGSVSTAELYRFGSYRDKVRLEDLKTMVLDGYSAGDNCHILDDFVVEIEGVKEYYQFNILPELDKILKQLA